MVKFVKSWLLNRKVKGATDFIVKKYGKTIQLLVDYDQGNLPEPKHMANNGDMQTFIRSFKQTIRSSRSSKTS